MFAVGQSVSSLSAADWDDTAKLLLRQSDAIWPQKCMKLRLVNGGKLIAAALKTHCSWYGEKEGGMP